MAHFKTLADAAVRATELDTMLTASQKPRGNQRKHCLAYGEEYGVPVRIDGDNGYWPFFRGGDLICFVPIDERQPLEQGMIALAEFDGHLHPVILGFSGNEEDTRLVAMAGHFVMPTPIYPDESGVERGVEIVALAVSHTVISDDGCMSTITNPNGPLTLMTSELRCKDHHRTIHPKQAAHTDLVMEAEAIYHDTRSRLICEQVKVDGLPDFIQEVNDAWQKGILTFAERLWLICKEAGRQLGNMNDAAYFPRAFAASLDNVLQTTGMPGADDVAQMATTEAFEHLWVAGQEALRPGDRFSMFAESFVAAAEPEQLPVAA